MKSLPPPSLAATQGPTRPATLQTHVDSDRSHPEAMAMPMRSSILRAIHALKDGKMRIDSIVSCKKLDQLTTFMADKNVFQSHSPRLQLTTAITPSFAISSNRGESASTCISNGARADKTFSSTRHAVRKLSGSSEPKEFPLWGTCFEASASMSEVFAFDSIEVAANGITKCPHSNSARGRPCLAQGEYAEGRGVHTMRYEGYEEPSCTVYSGMAGSTSTCIFAILQRGTKSSV